MTNLLYFIRAHLIELELLWAQQGDEMIELMGVILTFDKSAF
jgi:hypothetical protein